MPLLRTALVTAALAVSLTACGGGNAAKDAADTVKSGGYTPLTKASFGSEMADAMDDEKTVHVTGGVAGQTVDMWMEYGDDGIAMKGDMGTSEMLIVDGAFYMRQDGDAKWTTLPEQFSGTLLESLEQQSPEAMAAEYAKSLEKLTYNGEKKVDGQTLHSYTLDVSEEYTLKKAREQAKAMGMDPSTIKAGSIPDTDIITLLDDDNLMRQVEITAAGQKIVMKFSDWGKDVDIEAPAKSEIQSMTP